MVFEKRKDKQRTAPLSTTGRKHVGLPKMTARQNWGKYLAGLATEVSYAFFLMLIVVVLAFIALAVFGR